jgi:predicted Zn-dependent protease
MVRPGRAILTRVATRIALIVVALAGATWLTVSAGSFAAQDRIAKLALDTGKPTKAELATATGLVPRARRLNPDVRIEQGIGVLEFRTSERGAAVATFRRLTAREPRNAELWALLARVAKGYDETLSAAAGARARALSPPVRP